MQRHKINFIIPKLKTRDLVRNVRQNQDQAIVSEPQLLRSHVWDLGSCDKIVWAPRLWLCHLQHTAFLLSKLYATLSSVDILWS